MEKSMIKDEKIYFTWKVLDKVLKKKHTKRDVGEVKHFALKATENRKHQFKGPVVEKLRKQTPMHMIESKFEACFRKIREIMEK